MESANLISLIDVLDDNIDDLEEVLIPVLKGSLSETALKLPLLDKAQLYILVTYAIESILFCNFPAILSASYADESAYLRINGVNAKEHSVFRELTRVKQYFEKIKAANSAVSKPNVRLDRVAAGRFIKHALVRYIIRFDPSIADCAGRWWGTQR